MTKIKRRRKAGPDDKALGARIKKRRLEKGLSQTALGQAIDVSYQQIQCIEKGKSTITAVQLWRLSDLLGKDMD
ncbi:MAG: helix-turn-helix transcriptional regulator [Gammaproteobacteria bacterium]